MGEGRKRRKVPSGNRRRSGREAAPKASAGEETPAERRCWLCSRPLASGGVKSLLGRNVFEVHVRCYEQAMRM